ncbi:egg cell-secreted protein 1.2 [Carex littledalei]|uniref:Egg cell-secreted protein 1.2 n=1 Tax=Carex littledalei TaxID=544730 RepID=A0A833VA62_9POAL|nr:egg cell-secreted protein 1.2 [Carex littledalei]
MHHISKLVISLLLAITILSSTTTATRNAHLKINPNITKYASLQSRLQLSGGGSLVDCWNALTELKSCTSEIVLFFLNGESYLTIDCCHAIRTITFHCWPSMLSTVGFTAEEADILRGYCDAEVGPGAPVTRAPPTQSPAPAPEVAA